MTATSSDHSQRSSRASYLKLPASGQPGAGCSTVMMPSPTPLLEYVPPRLPVGKTNSVTEVISDRGHPHRSHRRVVQRGGTVPQATAPVDRAWVRRHRVDPVAGRDAALGRPATGYLRAGGGHRVGAGTQHRLDTCIQTRGRRPADP